MFGIPSRTEPMAKRIENRKDSNSIFWVQEIAPSHASCIMHEVYCPECRTRRGMIRQEEKIIQKDRKILKGRCSTCYTSITKIVDAKLQLSPLSP